MSLNLSENCVCDGFQVGASSQTHNAKVAHWRIFPGIRIAFEYIIDISFLNPPTAYCRRFHGGLKIPKFSIENWVSRNSVIGTPYICHDIHAVHWRSFPGIRIVSKYITDILFLKPPWIRRRRIQGGFTADWKFQNFPSKIGFQEILWLRRIIHITKRRIWPWVGPRCSRTIAENVFYFDKF